MRNTTVSLTDKQLRWIDEYLIDFNGAAAAVRAGYSEKSARSIAHENATKPDIQAVLRERQTALATELHISRTGVVKGLLEAVEMGRELRNPGAMVSALSTIAKMLGYYSPEVKRVELTAGQGAVQADFARMTDGQLQAVIAQSRVQH
jgi:phage terminase small subunit